MTTVVSRLYADRKTADAVVEALLAEGHLAENIDVIDAPEGAAERMRAARVSREAAARYAEKLGDGKALVVTRVPFIPFGAAANAIETVDRFDSVNAGVANQNEYIREQPSERFFKKKVLEGNPLMLTTRLEGPHRRFLTKSPAESGASIGLISEKFGLRLLSDRKTRNSAIRGGAFMSTRFLPFPLLSRGDRKKSVYSGRMLISEKLSIPLLTRRS